MAALTRTLLPWVLALSLSAGEVGAQLRATPVTAADVAYELSGYSVLPPPGNNWFELKRDPQAVYFGKRIASRTHAFVATALSVPMTEKFEHPEAFRDYIGRSLPSRGSSRHTILENKVEAGDVPGRFCARHYTKAEDRDAVQAQGKALLAETFGITCLHPDNPNLMVTVSYTERGSPGESNAALRAEGERFVRSLRFAPYQP